MIELTVTGQHAEICGTLVADSINYRKLHATFDSEWDGLARFVHFQKDDENYVWQLDENDELIISEAITKGLWRVSVHGNLFENGEPVMRVTTDRCLLRVLPSGIINDEPFPGVTSDYLERMQEMQTAAETAAQTAEAVREDLTTREWTWDDLKG